MLPLARCRLSWHLAPHSRPMKERSMYKPSLSLKANALKHLALNRLHQRPLGVTLELTRRCNARCDYCNHWKEQKQTEQELADFVAVVKRFQPLTVTIC